MTPDDFAASRDSAIAEIRHLLPLLRHGYGYEFRSGIESAIREVRQVLRGLPPNDAIGVERRARTCLIDDLDELKQRRFRPTEAGCYGLTLDSGAFSRILKQRYGGPDYEQTYQQQRTELELEEYYRRRERIFGVPSPDDDEIRRRAGYVKKRRGSRLKALAFADHPYFGLIKKTP